MDGIRNMVMEQLHKLAPNVPPHIMAPATIGVLALLFGIILILKASDKDVYEPRGKHVIKVEEVSSMRLPLYLS